MREIIDFLGKEIRRGIEDSQIFKCQAIEAVVAILNPWLYRVTMKNIGSILFAGEHGLEVGVHCRKRSFPKGITSKTQAFIGEHGQGRVLVKNADAPQNVYRYQQLHWALTRKGRWLRIEILYGIEYDHRGESVQKPSLCVEETSLKALIRDGWGYWILQGLSNEIQQVVGHRAEELQELISLRASVEFVNNLINKVVPS